MKLGKRKKIYYYNAVSRYTHAHKHTELRVGQSNCRKFHHYVM